jgi:hypothetical protein
MSFKEIIEIAKKRGLQAGKAKRADSHGKVHA